MQDSLKQQRLKHTSQDDLDDLLSRGVQESVQNMSYVTTEDGWELAVSEYHNADLQPVTKAHPVLLCHGLGSSRLMFDLRPELSLAKWLVGQGYAVYAVDLRGHGLSEKPSNPSSRKEKRYNWGFAHYLERDIKCVINHVLEQSKADSLHWIGHSMGGILLFSCAALGVKGIRSGIALGSSLNYSLGPSSFKPLLRLLPFSRLMSVMPLNLVGRFYASLNKVNQNWISSTFSDKEAIDYKVYRTMLDATFHPFSMQVMRDLARIIKGEGLLTLDGENINQSLEQRGYEFPILSVGGTADVQNCERSISAFGTEYKMYGKTFGHRVNYGHHDFLCGKHAVAEVYPDILSWFESHEQ